MKVQAFGKVKEKAMAVQWLISSPASNASLKMA
jgi:hypothetical protein